MPLTENQQYIVDAARRYNVDPALALSVGDLESGFNSEAQGQGGEIGLMQVTLPVWNKYGDPQTPRTDAQASADRGVHYLSDLIAQHKDPAVALYHYGPGKPAYVRQVASRFGRYQQLMAAQGQPAGGDDLADLARKYQAPAAPEPTAEDDVADLARRYGQAPVQAAEAPEYKGLTSDWWKPFTPEQAQILRPLLGTHPWLESAIQNSPEMVRSMLETGLITAGTVTGATVGAGAGAAVGSAVPVVGTGVGAGTGIVTGGAAGALLARKWGEEAGIIPTADPTRMTGMDWLETGLGAFTSLPQAVKMWAYGPAKTALEATDAVNKSKLRDYYRAVEDAEMFGGERPVMPAMERPVVPETGKLGQLVKKAGEVAGPYEWMTILTHPHMWPYMLPLTAAQGLVGYREYASRQLLDPANYARLRSLGVNPLAIGIAAGATDVARQRVMPPPQ